MATVTYTKQILSASVGGTGIKVAATGSVGTTIHTASTTPTTLQEIWLWAYNSDTLDRLLTIQFGGTTSPDNDIKISIPTQTGEFLVVPGFILQGNATPLVIHAYAAVANVITITGFVNQIQ